MSLLAFHAAVGKCMVTPMRFPIQNKMTAKISLMTQFHLNLFVWGAVFIQLIRIAHSSLETRNFYILSMKDLFLYVAPT